MDKMRWVAVLMVAVCLSACARHVASGAVAHGKSGSCLPSHDGYLRARLRGASNLDINWADDQLRCDGDPRPGHHGIRLTFAGRAQPGNHQLRFVFGIDAAPGPGLAHNVPADVTVIFEGERQLYSTRGTAQCTVDDLRQEPISTRPDMLRVNARGFCISAVSAVGGSGEVLLSRFDFAGPVLETDKAN